MERVCFTMRVAPENIGSYVAMHASAWPELLRELDRAGWANYSLFLREDGFLVGYWESQDPRAAMASMDGADVSPRWSAEMDRLVVPGSVMRYPRLVTATGEARAHAARGVFVAAAGHPVDPHGWSNLAIFETDDGAQLVYAEGAGVAPGAFREVFNLAERLDALVSGASTSANRPGDPPGP